MAKKKTEDEGLAADVSFLQSELSVALLQVDKLRQENLLLVAENARLATLVKNHEKDFNNLRNSMV
jgi:hypothetical protein